MRCTELFWYFLCTSPLDLRAARYHQSPFPPIFLGRETDFAEKA